MNIISNYDDIKFSIRCVDVWKNLKSTQTELKDALNYHKQRSSITEENSIKLDCIGLQDYLEMLIDVIQAETGTWFFYVDIAGVIFDQVQNKKIFIYQTDSGYVVVFEK